MNIIKKSFILFLSLSVLFLQFPNAAFAKFYTIAKVSSKITKKVPQVLSTPEEDIPVVEKAGPPKKGGSKMLWYILGLAVVAGIAAAAGGGGGGGDDDGGGGDGTGTITVRW